jgi:hypothetical protein
MQPVQGSGVCDCERQLMSSWYTAVEDFSRIASMLTVCDVDTAEYLRLKARAESARLHFDNVHTMWQLHCREHGCQTAPNLRRC